MYYEIVHENAITSPISLIHCALVTSQQRFGAESRAFS